MKLENATAMEKRDGVVARAGGIRQFIAPTSPIFNFKYEKLTSKSEGSKVTGFGNFW